MHILTKVFVVLSAVLSLMLASATMIYAYNAESVRTAYEHAELARLSSETALKTQSTAHASDIATLMGELEARDQRIAEIRGDVDALKIENDRLRREKFAAEADAERTKGQISQFRVAVQTQASLIESYKDEVASLREDELQFRDERLELEDVIADQSSQIEVFQQEIRALEEQLAAARSDLEAAQTGTAVARSDDAAAATPVQLSGPPVFGTVRAVRQEDATGKTLVQVDLGANDGVRENVKLLVFRGSTFVANLVLKRVDLQDSLAEVSLLAPGMTIMTGDRVTTRLVP